MFLKSFYQTCGYAISTRETKFTFSKLFFNKDIEMSYITLVYLIFTLDSKTLSRAYLPQPISYLHLSYILVWSCEYNSKCTHGFVPGYYHGQTMKSSTPRKQKMKVSSTTIRTRTSPSQ